MKLVEVKSSNVRSFGYQDKKLFVMFSNGSIYAYDNVPEELYHEALSADSKGKFLREKIYNKFTYMKILNEEAFLKDVEIIKQK